MGEACRAMETLMVCGDYRHAGMMSCTGCVDTCTSAQIPYNMLFSLHMCTSECVHLVYHVNICVSVCACVYIVAVCVGVCVCEYLCARYHPSACLALL